MLYLNLPYLPHTPPPPRICVLETLSHVFILKNISCELSTDIRKDLQNSCLKKLDQGKNKPGKFLWISLNMHWKFHFQEIYIG